MAQADLERMVILLKAEREACANLADTYSDPCWAADEIAKAIRARPPITTQGLTIRPQDATELSDGRLTLDLSTFALGEPWPLSRVYGHVFRELNIDPTYTLLLLSAAMIAGADAAELIKFADCVATMKALADACNIDLSEMEVIVEEGGTAS